MEILWSDTGLTEAGKTKVRVAMNLTAAKRAHPEHVLIALLEDAESPLIRACDALRPGFSADGLRNALIVRVKSDTPRTPIDQWSDDLLSERFQAVVQEMQSDGTWQSADESFRNQLFCAAMVKGLRSGVANTLSAVGVDCASLEERLRRPPVRRSEDAAVFRPDGTVNLDAFDRRAQEVLRLTETEGRGLGLSQVVTSLVLFAFASHENGLLPTALRLQAPTVKPLKVQENLAMHVRSLGSGRLNDDFQLHREKMQQAVVQTLERAAEEADLIELPTIGEAELLKAFLLAGDSFVESFLRNEKVDLTELSSYVAQRRSTEPQEVEEEGPTLLSIEDVECRLRSSILGQEHAVDSVMPIIKRLRFGYTRKGRPAGVFLFLGMSGTGKTALARAIASAVFGSEENLIFLEMGQFGSEHSKTSFVGAPPGLVGYGEGILTNGLRDRPESVVLFDEVEKAHKSVFDVVLRFLDEGQISDAAGAVRDGRRCVIVLTSNLAVAELTPLIREQSQKISMTAQDREKMRRELRECLEKVEFFRPEFLNRVDELILFNEITAPVYQQIVEQQLAAEQQRLRDEKQLKLTIEPDVAALIAARCAERSSEGARVCGRMISDLVITPLIDFFLQSDNSDVKGAVVGVDNEGRIVIRSTGDDVS